jgi:uncharacterized protein (DUF4415 family)
VPKEPEERRQIGVRLSSHHHRIARALALPDGLSIAKVLEPMLEDRLERLDVKARTLAQQFLNEVVQQDVNPELEKQQKAPDNGPQPAKQQISIRISADNFRIAKALAFEAGSVPKACEPLIEEALEERQREAAEAAQDLLDQLQRIPVAVGAPRRD